MRDFIARCRRAVRAFREEGPAEDAERAGSEPGPGAVVSPFMLGLHSRVLSGWYNTERAELVAGVHIAAGHTVVDVGCGEGGVSSFCAAQGAHVVLIDVDAKRLETAAERARASGARAVDCHLSSCDPAPLADAVADVVICTEVLEHVESPERHMAELARIGKPGARYVLTVPDAEFERLVTIVAPPDYFRHPNHIRIIERSEFAQLVQGAGLHIDRQEGIDAFWSFFWVANFMVGGWTDPPWHPVIEHWTRAWKELLGHPRGGEVKAAFDRAWPKTQIIVATKPGNPA